jgi:hypothetical protein
VGVRLENDVQLQLVHSFAPAAFRRTTHPLEVNADARDIRSPPSFDQRSSLRVAGQSESTHLPEDLRSAAGLRRRAPPRSAAAFRRRTGPHRGVQCRAFSISDQRSRWRSAQLHGTVIDAPLAKRRIEIHFRSWSSCPQLLRNDLRSSCGNGRTPINRALVSRSG